MKNLKKLTSVIKNQNNRLTVLILFFALTIVGCEKDVPTNDKIFTSENHEVPSRIWDQFSEKQQIEINTSVGMEEECNYFYEEFDIEFWTYPVYDNTGKLKETAYPVYGISSNLENGNSNLVINQRVESGDHGKDKTTLETGHANINYWFTQNDALISEQLIINVQSLQEDYFDLEQNITKFYISSGTGKYENRNGFAYAKIIVEQNATYGCYPNNSNYPDNFEDGTCAPFNDCTGACENGEGKGKLYLIGFTRDK